jgi:4-hydroxybenzoate polyprenyltransferase
MMDEVKDFKKDQIAHPDRPLPRGLVSYDGAKYAVNVGLAVMILFCALTYVLWGLTSAVLYGVTIFYLYLMYREFYCGPRLEKYPLVYAGSHQAILFLLCATAAACAGSPAGQASWSQWKVPETGLLMAGFQIFPAFFAYEIGRKMNPEAHPILGYYRQIYGLFGCRLILSVLVGLGALGLFWGVTSASFITEAGLYIWFGLGSLGLALSFLTTWIAGDRRYKWIGHATTINLLLAVYAPILAFYGFS